MRYPGETMGVEEAYESLEEYGRIYGKLPLRLLLHVAVPQRFRADFVNLVKLNFLPAEAQGDLSLDADVLFSPVVEHLGMGYFRMDPEVRRQSLMLLDAAYRAFGELRSVRVADLLLAYLANLEHRAAVGLDPLLEEYIIIERWVAYAFLDPADAAARFAWALKQATDAEVPETPALKVRFGSIAAAITIPLAGQQDLLEYARGYDALVAGRTQEVARTFRRLGDGEIRVGGVVLRPGTELLARRLSGDVGSTAEEATSAPATLIQYFHSDYPADGSLWKKLYLNVQDIANAGFTAIWLPPPYKGESGSGDTGYGPYDLFDLGEFDQKGSVRTKYGLRQELETAIHAAHDLGLLLYITVVIDHKSGADSNEIVIASPVHNDNQNIEIGPPREIGAWTGYQFPGRGESYSEFKWCWQHFNFTFYDQITGSRSTYRLKDKFSDIPIDHKRKNDEYELGSTIDFSSDEVRHELIKWGEWISEVLNIDGFIVDAVNQIRFDYLNDWLDRVRGEEQRQRLFAIGEHSSGDVETIKWFTQQTGRRMSLFDFILHSNMRDISRDKGGMKWIFDGTLVAQDPTLAVTFVDNHDTYRENNPGEGISEWFRPLAYALILLREGGYPCVFYPDYFGGAGRNSIRPMLDALLVARRNHAYGNQSDYFDDINVVGWTRTGDAYHPKAMAVVMSNNIGSTKRMLVNRSNAYFRDVTGSIKTNVMTIEDGYGDFSCLDRSVSVWLELSTGTVKWYSDEKGFGFITQDGTEIDIFVHHTSIMTTGFKILSEGQRVYFNITHGPKGLQATDVTQIDLP